MDLSTLLARLARAPLPRRPRPRPRAGSAPRRSVLAVEPLEARSLPSTSTLPDGIASGDTTANSTVLWAHSTAPGTVRFTYGTDPTFRHAQGSLAAQVTDPAQPVKVQVTGLAPHQDYYYQVVD